MSVNTSNLNLNKLAAGLSLAIALIGVGTHAVARGVRIVNVTAVTSCADDDSPGTLRQVIANSTSGAQIDLSGLSCANNEIALTQGEIAIEQDVSLFGAAGGALTITSDMGRVLRSTATSLSLTNLTISGGDVFTKSGDAEGGCILAAGNVSLNGSVVRDCTARSTNSSARGGAISAISVSLVNSRVSGSSATSTGYYQLARGGGVYAASLSCTDSTLSGNLVSGDSSNGYGQGGGALIPGGDVVLSRCTINSNVAGEGGGLMQIVFPGSMATRNPPQPSPVTSIQNSTISGNTATFASAGVKVFCTDCTAQTVQILNSTIAFNSSPLSYGDGITTNGSVNAQSSIFSNNGANDGSAFEDVFATGLTGADNLVMATNVKPAAGVVTVSDDPMLLPLADNGGLTQTHNMDASSPAMQLGNNSAAFTTDQRGNGYARSANGMVDIGAFQHCQPAMPSSFKLPPYRGH